MSVFLDTNIFFNNWYVTNLNFKLLFHYLANEGHTLLLSEVVVKEVNNKREQQATELISELLSKLKKLNYLNEKPLKLPKEINEIQPYDIRDILGCKAEHIDDISFNNIEHEEVVERALKSVKPFTSGEKGYRDTLIWLSFLRYLKENSVKGDVAFITANATDFFVNNNKELQFHSSLQNDIDSFELECKIIPFNSLHSFLSTSVDKIENSINKNSFLDDNESFLMEETVSFIESLEGSRLSDFLDTPNFHTKLPYVKEVQAAIFDGIEDPEVYSVSNLSGDLAYVDAFFEMRELTFNLVIDINEYRANADYIEQLYGLYNIELNKEQETVTLGFHGKISVTAAIGYNLKTSEVTEIDFNEAYYQ